MPREQATAKNAKGAWVLMNETLAIKVTWHENKLSVLACLSLDKSELYTHLYHVNWKIEL